MARIGLPMQLKPVDQDCNLFTVSQVISQDLQQKILTTDWMNLKFSRQEGQETWPRRRIDTHCLDWYPQWHTELTTVWPQLEHGLQTQLESCSGTAFWIDEPGFVCSIHTDGELPGSLHLSWIGDANLGTTFYHSKNPEHVRFKHNFQANSGYAMINQPDSTGYRRLQWHGMLEPVPDNSYRLTSYTWLNPVK